MQGPSFTVNEQSAVGASQAIVEASDSRQIFWHSYLPVERGTATVSIPETLNYSKSVFSH